MISLERVVRIAHTITPLPQDLLESGIKRRHCRKEARLLRDYFRSSDGLQTLVEFYIRAQTAHYEPAGLLDSEKKQFEFLEAPKEYATYLNALLNKDKKGMQAFIDALEKDIKQDRDGSDSISIAQQLLPLVQEYAAGASNLGIVWSGLNEYFRSFSKVPDKKGILVHLHPTPHPRDSESKGKYSKADYRVALHRPLGLITYAHHVEHSGQSPFLSVSFVVRHSYGFSEERVDCVNGCFPLQNSVAQWKRKVSYLTAVHLLSKSGYVLPFLAYDKNEDCEKEIRAFVQEQFDTIAKIKKVKKENLQQAINSVIDAELNVYRVIQDAARTNVCEIWQREL